MWYARSSWAASHATAQRSLICRNADSILSARRLQSRPGSSSRYRCIHIGRRPLRTLVLLPCSNSVDLQQNSAPTPVPHAQTEDDQKTASKAGKGCGEPRRVKPSLTPSTHDTKGESDMTVTGGGPYQSRRPYVEQAMLHSVTATQQPYCLNLATTRCCQEAFPHRLNDGHQGYHRHRLGVITRAEKRIHRLFSMFP